jgi:hypothetical protein
MELIPLMSAYLVCSAGLGIAAGKLITRRRELTVKAPAPYKGGRIAANRRDEERLSRCYRPRPL